MSSRDEMSASSLERRERVVATAVAPLLYLNEKGASLEHTYEQATAARSKAARPARTLGIAGICNLYLRPHAAVDYSVAVRMNAEDRGLYAPLFVWV